MTSAGLRFDLDNHLSRRAPHIRSILGREEQSRTHQFPDHLGGGKLEGAETFRHLLHRGLITNRSEELPGSLANDDLAGVLGETGTKTEGCTAADDRVECLPLVAAAVCRFQEAGDIVVARLTIAIGLRRHALHEPEAAIPSSLETHEYLDDLLMDQFAERIWETPLRIAAPALSLRKTLSFHKGSHRTLIGASRRIRDLSVDQEDPAGHAGGLHPEDSAQLPHGKEPQHIGERKGFEASVERVHPRSSADAPGRCSVSGPWSRMETVRTIRTVPWNPERYLRFADQRMRPGLELLARIPPLDAHHIADLGSGTGHLTARLSERWPSASVVGVDSSAEMIDRARRDHKQSTWPQPARPRLTWALCDLATWEPDEPVDVLFSNSAFHWLEDHQTLFPRLRALMSRHAVIAIQMPDNWQAPSHRIPVEILDGDDWSSAARAALMRNRLAAPDAYARWLQPAAVDMWRTTYYQRLSGDEPIWTWVTGSLLQPVLAAMNESDRNRFSTLCRSKYEQAYPADGSGFTTFAFSRLFMVATVT